MKPVVSLIDKQRNVYPCVCNLGRFDLGHICPFFFPKKKKNKGFEP